MENNSLLDLHKNQWYSTTGIDFKDIEPHIENFKKVDDLVPPGPRFFLVINLHTYKYDFIGKGQQLLSGYDNKVVQEGGINFQMAHMHPEDGEFIVSFSYKKYNELLDAHAADAKKDIVLQHNYRFRHKNGNYIHLMEQVWGAKTDENGKIKLLLAQVYQLPMPQPFKVNMIIKKLLPNKTSYQTLFTKSHPEAEQEIPLGKREREIINLLAEGYTSTQIAEKLSISYHTVRTHRKNVLQKLEMKSTNELVAYGITNGLI